MKAITFNLTETEVVTLQQVFMNARRGKITAYSRFGWPRLTDEIDLLNRLLITLNNPDETETETSFAKFKVEPLDRDIQLQGQSIKTVDVATLQLSDLIKRRRSIQRALTRAQSGATKTPTKAKLEFWKTELNAVVAAIYTHYQSKQKMNRKYF
jgi:hypothetical protein